VTSVESITVILIENVPATTIVTVENPPVSAPNISAPNNSLGEALAVVALSASEPNTPHVNPPAISIAAAPTEGSNGTVPLASVQFVHSVDAVIRGIEAASPMPVQISSGTELAPMPPLASAPSNHQEFADERGVSPIPISVAANSLAFAAAAHDALMLGVPVNFAAIDRAFGAVRNGIEAMGKRRRGLGRRVARVRLAVSWFSLASSRPAATIVYSSGPPRGPETAWTTDRAGF